jgi:hypothetical protein
VGNHGKHWINLGHIISVDKNTKSAVVKWEETQKKDTIDFGDCKKYNKLDIIPRRQKSTEFLCDTTDKEGEATSWPNEKHVLF